MNARIPCVDAQLEEEGWGKEVRGIESYMKGQSGLVIRIVKPARRAYR